MTKAAAPTVTPPKRRGFGRKVFIPLALVTAIGGFATGMLGGPLFAPTEGTGSAEVVQMHAGTFPIATAGAGTRMVDANVSVRADASAPDGPGPLRDAVFSLLTEASAMPLVLDGRDTLADLEKVVMSMAPAAAPWLVALELQPSEGLSTAALEPDEKDEAATES